MWKGTLSISEEKDPVEFEKKLVEGGECREPTSDRRELAVSCRWSGWVWEETGWSTLHWFLVV